MALRRVPVVFARVDAAGRKPVHRRAARSRAHALKGSARAGRLQDAHGNRLLRRAGERSSREALMPKIPYRVHPETAVLTRGFDPELSVGSARPPVYRSSTFVFPSPEAAERAFGIVLGKIRPLGDDRPDLIYARLNHPNAEILEEQLVPLERGANSAAIFNSGMAAIFTVMLAFLERGGSLIYTQPLYGGTQHLIHQVIEPLGFATKAVPAGDARALSETIAQAENPRLVLIEPPANPTLMMSDIAQAAAAVRQHPKRPL